MERKSLASKASALVKTPKSRINIIDSSSIQASSRRKEVDNPYEPLDFGASLEHKEKHLDDRFKSLIDRCAKSKEYLDSLHKNTSTSERSPVKSTMVSPSSRSGLPLGPNSFETKRLFLNTARSNNWEKENNYSSIKEKEAQDFDKLESDLIEFKNEIIDKFQKSGKKQNVKTYSSNSSDSENDKKAAKYQSIKTNSIKEKRKVPNKSMYDREVLSPKTINSTKYSTHKPSKNQEEDDYMNEHYLSTENDLDKERKKTSKSINKLKSVMKQKEKMEYEKYLALKAKAKEFKNILREYVNKVMDLENNLKKKDEIIIELEEQSKESQQELLKNFDTLKDLKRRNDEHRKMEEEMKNSNIEYKVKLNEYKKKLEKIEDSAKLNEERLRGEIDGLKEENALMRRDLSVSREKEDQIVESNQNFQKQIVELQDELNSKVMSISKFEKYETSKERETKELRDQLEKYLIENKHLNARFEDVKAQITHLEERNSKNKRKSEEEKNTILDEFQKKIARKSEKNKVLKEKLKELEAYLNILNDEKNGMAVEMEKIASIKVQNDREINKLREDLSSANHEM